MLGSNVWQLCHGVYATSTPLRANLVRCQCVVRAVVQDIPDFIRSLFIRRQIARQKPMDSEAYADADAHADSEMVLLWSMPVPWSIMVGKVW